MECLGNLILTMSAIKPIDCCMGFLKRNLHQCSSDLKEMAYKQLILPSLGYCMCSYLGPFSSQFDLSIGDDSAQSSTFCTEQTMD